MMNARTIRGASRSRTPPPRQVAIDRPFADPAPGEKTAEAAAQRATDPESSTTDRTEERPEAQPRSHDYSRLPVGSRQAVQAKMGFEFETSNEVRYQEEEEPYDYEGFERKDLIYSGVGFKAETDTETNFEFIIKEQDTLPALKTGIDNAVALCDEINSATSDKLLYIDAGTNHWVNKELQITVKSEAWTASAQATEGLELSAIADYIEDVLSKKDYDKLQELYEDANLDEMSAGVRGLIDLMVYFVKTWNDWDGSLNDEGPKNAGVFMQRTDFASMFESLEKKERVKFKALFYANKKWRQDNPITETTGVKGKHILLPEPYYQDVGKKRKTKWVIKPGETKLKDWIDSVMELGGEKDLMSPPVGWRGSDYGQGLMEMDSKSVGGKDLALFEYRKTDSMTKKGVMDGRSLIKESWYLWVEEVYNRAKARNNTLK